uniref:Antitoxin n=1 Tax=Angiostrongylus cantonensis TaxID=6313 RepID=A0A158P8Q3_ANGCA
MKYALLDDVGSYAKEKAPEVKENIRSGMMKIGAKLSDDTKSGSDKKNEGERGENHRQEKSGSSSDEKAR